MKYLIYLLLFNLVLVSCQKDRANWDPTPEIYNIDIIRSSCAPDSRIDFTSPPVGCEPEWWARLLISGKKFKDNLVAVNSAIVMKDGYSIDCSIKLIEEEKMECTVYGFDFSWAGAGTYYVKVKMPDSDWSNTASFEVY